MINHEHNGVDAKRIKVKNLLGTEGDVQTFVERANFSIETVTTFPSDEPTSFFDQIRIFDDTGVSGDLYLCVYDSTNTLWRKFIYTP